MCLNPWLTRAQIHLKLHDCMSASVTEKKKINNQGSENTVAIPLCSTSDGDKLIFENITKALMYSNTRELLITLKFEVSFCF